MLDLRASFSKMIRSSSSKKRKLARKTLKDGLTLNVKDMLEKGPETDNIISPELEETRPYQPKTHDQERM